MKSLPENTIRRISDTCPDGSGRLTRILRPFLRLSVTPNGLIHQMTDRSLNPLTQTGAISNTLLLIAVISGVLLLFWYTPSVNHAYSSLESMRSSVLIQLIRSLHRYSSDGCVFFILLHALKYFFAQKFTTARWIAWVTGLFAMAVLWIEGLTGYWLVWDVRARQIALGSAKLMDLIPVFDEPMSRSFLTNENLNSLLFFVVFFFHMLLPLLMVGALWLHIARLNRPNFLTKRTMTIWIMLTLVCVSIIRPAINAAPADMSSVPEFFTMDWWYLFPLVLIERLNGGLFWAVSFFTALILYTMPWWRKRAVAANVNPALCDGCTNCYRDCPYNAITMVSRGESENALSSVDPSLCTGCGICTASCPTLAISLPNYSLRNMRPILDRWQKETEERNEDFFPAFICSASGGAMLTFDPESGICKDLPGYHVMSVPCAGWIHARIVERLLRLGARGVLIAGCGPGECSFRHGGEITEMRLNAALDPEFRIDRAGNGNVKFLQLDGLSPRHLRRRAEEFRANLKKSPPLQPGKILKRITSIAAGLMVSLIVGVLVWLGSDLSYRTPFQGDPLLVVSFHHPGTTGEACRKLTSEELAARPVHMRSTSGMICERGRNAVRLRVFVDNIESSAGSYRPSGLWHDGASLAIESIPVKEGRHRIKIQIGDTADTNEWTFQAEQEISFSRWQRRVVLFERTKGFTWH